VSVVSVYVTFANADEAETIGHKLVAERLAACINILGPVRSIYRWKGSVEAADEVAAIVKTTGDEADALIARIAELHSYDVPCITTCAVDEALDAYAAWVEDSVR
jgi:periplasmic divalent cation tolerance protein